MSNNKQQIFCNVKTPDLFKIAQVTKHSITNLHKRGNKLYVYLDGTLVTVEEARKKMLQNVELYTFNNISCEI